MKKSIVISLLTVMILFCTAIYSFASTGRVTTDTLRLRKDASTDASILALLSIDNEVEILEEKNGWYKVKATVDGKEYLGYVAKEYIDVKEDKTLEEDNKNNTQDNPQENNDNNTDNGENQEEKVLVKTVASGVKVYITPVINSLVLDTLTEEKQIEVISEVNGWSYVSAALRSV